MTIETLLGRMTLDEKIGQLFLLAFSGHRTDEARRLMEERAVGAAYISNDNIPTAEAAARLTDTLQRYAAGTRLGIPLLLGADQEGAWGVMVPESSTGPGNMALGAARDPALTYEMYATIAKELAAVGLNALFAPCADCNSNPENSIIGMRSFGEDPELVGALAAAAVRGVTEQGVVATAKHFPGHGDTIVDSHRGLPTVGRTKQELVALDLHPFARAIEAGAAMVMTAHIQFTALDRERPATLSRGILGDLLRGELGFQGVILSDSMNMGAMKRNYAPEKSVILALDAGVDLVMLAEEGYDHDPEHYLERQVALLDAVKGAVEGGTLAETRVDDAVRRVLSLKARFGLLDVARAAKERPLDVVGCREHREVELRAARGAVAVLKDAGEHVPLAPSQQVVLVNATTRSSYEVLARTRGIGPNQTIPAFDRFAAAVRRRRPDAAIVAAEDVLGGASADAWGGGRVVVVVTENYPLPGVDFDQASQPRVVRRLLETAADRLVVVGLRDPYELRHFPDVPTYVCAFSFRPCAADAAAEVLFGESPALGRTPVTVPGTGIAAAP